MHSEKFINDIFNYTQCFPNYKGKTQLFASMGNETFIMYLNVFQLYGHRIIVKMRGI